MNEHGFEPSVGGAWWDSNMTESTDPGDAPPPPPPADDYADLDRREEFFTGTLQHADRMANAAEAVRLHLMLAGMDAMLLEEQAIWGRQLSDDDSVVRGFYLHQANTLRTTQHDVKTRLQGARMLRDRLPRTWAVFLGGLASEDAAVTAAFEAIGLTTDEHFAAFDEQAATMVQEERPTAIKRKLADLRDELEPDAATTRHRSATDRRFVRARPAGDGQGVLEIHSTASDIAAAYDRIHTRAVAAHGRDGECRTLGQLMVDSAIDAILTGTMRGPEQNGPSYPMERLGETDDPTRKVIDATILVVVPAETATGAADRVGEVAGMGSIDGEVARMIVKHTRTWTRVLVDPVPNVVLGIDTHERYIPAGLKKLLHYRQRTCACGCGLPAHRADWAHGAGSDAAPKATWRPCDGDDHIIRFEHDGRTRHDNLQILCRKSHLGKDEEWMRDVRVLDDGRTRWRNKWGGVTYTKPAVSVRTETAEPEPVYADDAPF